MHILMYFLDPGKGCETLDGSRGKKLGAISRGVKVWENESLAVETPQGNKNMREPFLINNPSH